MSDTDDIDVLARTLWAEARGEGEAGMVAVAAVIMNRCRAAADYRRRKPGKSRHVLFGDGSPASACQMPWQFSCWNQDDPNRGKLLAVTSDDPWFAAALRIAAQAVAHELVDPTGGATHYVRHDWVSRTAWTKTPDGAPRSPTAKIGNHWFYLPT